MTPPSEPSSRSRMEAVSASASRVCTTSGLRSDLASRAWAGNTSRSPSPRDPPPLALGRRAVVVVVEPALADRDAVRLLAERLELAQVGRSRSGSVVRMDPCRGAEERTVGARQLEGVARRGHPRPGLGAALV